MKFSVKEELLLMRPNFIDFVNKMVELQLNLSVLFPGNFIYESTCTCMYI